MRYFTKAFTNSREHSVFPFLFFKYFFYNLEVSLLDCYCSPLSGWAMERKKGGTGQGIRYLSAHGGKNLARKGWSKVLVGPPPFRLCETFDFDP